MFTFTGICQLYCIYLSYVLECIWRNKVILNCHNIIGKMDFVRTLNIGLFCYYAATFVAEFVPYREKCCCKCCCTNLKFDLASNNN